MLSNGEDPRAFHNRFPVEWHRVNREAMDASRPDGDWATFARSGWTGVQRHSMIHWIGDQEATWSPTDGLPTVVPAMINLGLAGVPYVTHDIGGFSGGPSTKELYLRWIELGARVGEAPFAAVTELLYRARTSFRASVEAGAATDPTGA